MTTLIYAAIAALCFIAYTTLVKTGSRPGQPDYISITVASIAWPVSLVFVISIFLFFAGKAAFEHSRS